jgi:rare lipoprotein A
LPKLANFNEHDILDTQLKVNGLKNMQTPCKSWLTWGTRIASRLVLAGLVMTSTTWLNTANAKAQAQRKPIHNTHKSEKKTKLIVKNHKNSKSTPQVKKLAKAPTPKRSHAKKPLPKLSLKTSVKAKANAIKPLKLKLSHKAEKTLKTSKVKPIHEKAHKISAKLSKSVERLPLKKVQWARLSKPSKVVKAKPVVMLKQKTKHELKQAAKAQTKMRKLEKHNKLSLKPAKLLAPQKKSAHPTVRLNKSIQVTKRESRIDNKPKIEEKRDAGRVLQVGTASYYGSGFHGGRTANGERFNQNDLTCAHNGLPFGCKIRVTNLRNNKSVDVRVNDRGGFAKHGRVIDLSKAAAGKIGMLGSGTAKVKIQVVH